MSEDTTEYYQCTRGHHVVDSEQLAHESWCDGKPSGLEWHGADNAPVPAGEPEKPATLTWRRNTSGNYYAEYRELGASFLVGKVGERRWFIECWPTALPGLKQYVRTEYGITTMASARAMALSTPCFRCGRGRPLILMERYTPRWRCLDHGECEAERARLLGAARTARAIEPERNPLWQT